MHSLAREPTSAVVTTDLLRHLPFCFPFPPFLDLCLSLLPALRLVSRFTLPGQIPAHWITRLVYRENRARSSEALAAVLNFALLATANCTVKRRVTCEIVETMYLLFVFGCLYNVIYLTISNWTFLSLYEN